MPRKIFNSFSIAERYIFWIALALAVLSLLALLVIAVNQSTKIVPASGGDYTEGIVGQPIYPNPVLASSETDKSLVRLLFSNLYELADKISPDQNGRVWDVRLKENLVWSDGQKLTSDDVIFTIEKIQDPNSNSPLFLDWQGVVPNRISELEIRFNLASPYAFFEDNLKGLYILPRHLFSETPAANWRLSKYNLQPVGSGPYEFDSYEAGPDGFITSYRLKFNNNYFNGKPLIQNFRLNFYRNKDNLINSFNDGGIDGAAGLEAADLKNINRPYQLLDYSLPDYYAVFFNQSQNLPLQDAKVRQAMSLAIDRIELIKDIFGNKAEGIGGPVIKNVLPAGPNVSSTIFSPDLAGQILDKDGWKMASSGVRQKNIKNNNVNLTVDLTVPQINFLTGTAQKIQKFWQKIGVQTNLSILSPDEVAGDIIKNRNYQALLYGNILNLDSDLFSFWHSSERFYPGSNLSLYENKQADTLIESIRQTTSSDERTSQFGNLQKTITNDYPAIFLYSPDYLYVTIKDLRGAATGMIADPADRFSDVAKWFVKTARVLK